MGLDSFFRIKKYTTPDWEDLKINLVGGMFSGHGNDGSFRGKVYAQLLEELTGVDIYEEELDHVTIQKMYSDIRNVPYVEAKEYSPYELNEGEWEDLKKLFKRAAETDNCVLLGWW